MRAAKPLLTVAALGTLCFFARAARGAEITAISRVPMEATTVVVHAERLDRPADPIERQIQVPAVNTLPLPEGVWEVELRSGAAWAPRMYLRNGDSVTIPVWPVAELKGTAKGLTKLNVAFEPLDAGGAKGETSCRIAGAAWSCAIPPGRYDLRFSSPAAAPEYRFGETIPGEWSTELQFVAGASLTGRLEAPRGTRISLDGVEILLRRDGATAGQHHSTKSNAKGFFQFKGLTPGSYVLRARRQGLTAQTRAVTIVEGMAAELNAPLTLDHPKRLTAMIFPSLDPDLRPWRVSLSSHRPGSQSRLDVVSESSATPSGEWSISSLITGDYRVHVRRANGERWKSQDVHVADSDATVHVTALGDRISGTVTIGGRPLESKLTFGGEGGVTLLSNHDGRFEGEIPANDDDEWRIVVDAEALQIVRTVRAKLERTGSGERRLVLELPATVLMGQVLRGDRSPAPHALITISGNGPTQQAVAENDGSFQITALPPGDYRVTAETGDGKSEPAHASITSDAPTELVLVLLDDVVVRGRIGIRDTPVMQADIYAIPRDTAWAPFMPQTRSTESGRFQLKLPPRTTVYDLVAVHPAFDLVLTRLPVQTDSVRHVVATQVGGTLVVESSAASDLLLRHGGGECWLTWLASRPGAGGVVESARVVVPRLEPGEYSVCSAKTKVCQGGYLAPYGTLTLAMN